MGIPRKKSRAIVVGGKPFRWMLKGNSRYYEDTPRCLRFIAQEDCERPGRVLVEDLVSKNWKPDHEDLGGHKASFIPTDAEKLIHAALEQGWVPSERGAAFRPGLKMEFQDFVTEYFNER